MCESMLWTMNIADERMMSNWTAGLRECVWVCMLCARLMRDIVMREQMRCGLSKLVNDCVMTAASASSTTTGRVDYVDYVDTWGAFARSPVALCMCAQHDLMKCVTNYGIWVLYIDSTCTIDTQTGTHSDTHTQQWQSQHTTMATHTHL